AVRDEGLAAVDDVLVADLLRARADARHVRARAGLAHAERGDAIAGERGPEELLLLLPRAELVDARRRHVALDEEAHRDARGLAADELFALHDAEPVVAAAAADVLRVVRARDAELAGLLEHPVGEVLVPLPLVG